MAPRIERIYWPSAAKGRQRPGKAGKGRSPAKARGFLSSLAPLIPRPSHPSPLSSLAPIIPRPSRPAPLSSLAPLAPLFVPRQAQGSRPLPPNPPPLDVPCALTRRGSRNRDGSRSRTRGPHRRQGRVQTPRRAVRRPMPQAPWLAHGRRLVARRRMRAG